MKLTPKPRRSTSDTQLIPLINVIFLMLIFFMLAGHIGAPEPFPVAPPRAAQSDDQAESQIPSLLLGADGRLALDGQLVSAETLAAALAARQAAAPADPAGSPKRIRLKADAAVRVGDLHALIDQLRASGFDEIALITQQGR